jgi:hypothetical protein
VLAAEFLSSVLSSLAVADVPYVVEVVPLYHVLLFLAIVVGAPFFVEVVLLYHGSLFLYLVELNLLHFHLSKDE